MGLGGSGMVKIASTRRKAAPADGENLPAVIAPTVAAPIIKSSHGTFDLDDPHLPKWVEERAFKSGGYPYADRIENASYEDELVELQIELVKLQRHLGNSGMRVVLLFEGRDAAGKGGAIFVFRQYLNPRQARTVALPAPTETERGQWYFQRYVDHFPTSGEFVTFDRSWYNRAGVEPVMGFCSPEQHAQFLKEVPRFEKMISNEGIHLFKFWLDIGRETQLDRFHDRRHSPLRNWKFTAMDVAGITKWDDYTEKRDLMFERTHSSHAPWIILRANDKRRTRLEVIRRMLLTMPYEDRDLDAIGKPDHTIIGEGPSFLAG
jgi:polyphosphate kinase 2